MFKNPVNLRTGLILTYRISLLIAVFSLFYLLFMFGHTDVTPLNRIWLVAVIAGISALVAGMLQWIGLPQDNEKNQRKSRKK